VNDVKYVVPHQANIRIIDAVGERLEVPKERMYVNLDRYGNTSSRRSRWHTTSSRAAES